MKERITPAEGFPRLVVPARSNRLHTGASSGGLRRLDPCTVPSRKAEAARLEAMDLPPQTSHKNSRIAQSFTNYKTRMFSPVKLSSHARVHRRGLRGATGSISLRGIWGSDSRRFMRGGRPAGLSVADARSGAAAGLYVRPGFRPLRPEVPRRAGRSGRWYPSPRCFRTRCARRA